MNLSIQFISSCVFVVCVSQTPKLHVLNVAEMPVLLVLTNDTTLVTLLGHLVNMVVLVLPLRHIVKLYLHILTALLLYVGHQISK